MSRPEKEADYRTRLVPEIGELDAAHWNALLPDAPGAVFLRHEWLHALEASGCVGGDTGWQPLHLALEDATGHLAGAMPLYAKNHSYGEYVFDWAWADAYRRNGLEYYPKLLSAVPFTPVSGARVLTADPALLDPMVRAIGAQARRTGVSSLHVLFPDDAGRDALARAGFLMRHGVQFHWQNPGYRDFEQFLGELAQPKRKKIRAERRKVSEAGVRSERRCGSDIREADWAFFMRCYNTTYREHHSTPYLNKAFFVRLAETMPDAFVMIIARVDGEPVASSLLVRDEHRLYGRYWGAVRFISQLHFEVAYYQSIEAAIELGIAGIEGGAQGEHKMARGFVARPTCSAHWLAEPAFAEAVDRFLAQETTAIGGYLDELNERQPFRKPA